MTLHLWQCFPLRSSRTRLACLLCVSLLATVSVAEAGRFNLTLDDGVTVVVVDNYSSYPDVHAGNLVIGADRSTQDDGMFYRPRKGFFAAGNRILVKNKYVAWFHTGMLLGYWSLNPATGLYKYPRTGPNGFANWSHNEFLRGSASPQQQVWPWDTGSPGIEHSMGFPTAPNFITLITHHNGYFAANGNWSTIYDGTVINGEVNYATGSRLAGTLGFGPQQVDVSDGNDSNGIQNYVESQLGFVCREDDIRVVWRFKPATAPVSPALTYYHLWAHYSFDGDGSSCDTDPTNNYPDQVWGEPAFFRSNKQMWDGFVAPLPANTIHPLVRGVPCLPNQGVVQSTYPPPVAHGDWIQWGESSTLSAGTPRWTLTNVNDASLGTPITWDYMHIMNELLDGVWGAGAIIRNSTFAAGIWHVTSYVLSAQ